MGKKKKKSRKLRPGAVVFLVAVLFWLVVSHPWLLLVPIAYWFCFSRPSRPEAVRRRPPPQPVTPTPAPRVIPRPVQVTPSGFIQKDRKYNRYLARTWDEEFAALVRKGEHVPPS